MTDKIDRKDGQNRQAPGGLLDRIVSLFRDTKAKFRLFLGRCPACNSDAPDVYHCKICNNWSAMGVPSDDMKSAWWRRYKMAKCTHGLPMEDQCFLCCQEIFYRRPHYNVDELRRG